MRTIAQDNYGSILGGHYSGSEQAGPVERRISLFPNEPMVSCGTGPKFVVVIKEDRSGMLWVTSQMVNGLSSLDAKTGEFKHFAFSSEKSGSESVAGLNVIHEDRNGVRWLGTRSENSIRRFGGILWVGNRAGVSRIQRPPHPPCHGAQCRAGWRASVVSHK